jgi:hypothetical protein
MHVKVHFFIITGKLCLYLYETDHKHTYIFYVEYIFYTLTVTV